MLTILLRYPVTQQAVIPTLDLNAIAQNEIMNDGSWYQYN
jgi:hypothetical protein